MEFLLIIVPNSFFQTSNSGHKWSLCRRHGALNLRLERVLSSFLHIVVQNFRNNDCWPFHFRFSNLVNPAKSSFCAEGMEHWNHFWPESEARKNEIGRVNIHYCQNLGQRRQEMLTKPSQSVVSVLYGRDGRVMYTILVGRVTWLVFDLTQQTSLSSLNESNESTYRVFRVLLNRVNQV